MKNTVAPPINSSENEKNDIAKLCTDSISLIDFARSFAMQRLNIIQLLTYYSIGKWIVEVQQNGENRASYGKQVLLQLSESLTDKFGKGFSVDTLEKTRKFYLTYKDRISATEFRKFAVEKSQNSVADF